MGSDADTSGFAFLLPLLFVILPPSPLCLVSSFYFPVSSTARYPRGDRSDHLSSSTLVPSFGRSLSVCAQLVACFISSTTI
jgi:hypothetical protein